MAKLNQITNIDMAVRMYYERLELSNADISELFGVTSSKTIAALKKKVKAEMATQNCMPWNSACVNTEIAYKVWGLDIADLERRRAKIMKLNGATMKEEKQ